jgi:hypothetical protein
MKEELSVQKRRLFLARKAVFMVRVFEFLGDYDETTLIEFYNHWSEPNEKWVMRWEREHNWNFTKRLKTWTNV